VLLVVDAAEASALRPEHLAIVEQLQIPRHPRDHQDRSRRSGLIDLVAAELSERPISRPCG
jgi:hypothetical protein